MKLKKKVALLLVIMLLFNIFSPYIPLLSNRTLAATGVLEENPLILNNLGITTKGSNRILKVEIALVSEAVINGFDLQFKIDPDKLAPCNKNTGAATNTLTLIMAQSDYYAGTLQIKEYDKDTNTFHFTATEPAGGTDIAEDLGYIPGEIGDPAIDENGAGYPVYYPVLTLSFKVMDDSITEDNITLDMFELVPITVGLPTGLKVNYTNTDSIRVSKDIELGGKNFAEPEKEIESISVANNPSKMTYNHGDTVNLSGGKILVTYTDKSTEEIDMTSPEVSIISGSPANVNNKTVTVSYKGKTCGFGITVNDQISSLAVTKSMTDLEYTHGENFDFTGLQLTATMKSGAKQTLNYNSSGVSINETQANVNSDNFTPTSTMGDITTSGTQKITFTYQGKTATQTVVVNDTIEDVEIISQPTKKLYKYGENLDLSGGTVRVTLGSGASTDIDLPDGIVEVSDFSSTTTGTKQNLTATVNGIEASDTIDVEVYDYIKDVKLTEPNKAEYKYGENLSTAGGRLTLTWGSGKITYESFSEDMVTGYDNTQIGPQTLTVTYDAKYELSDGSTVDETFKETFDIEVINPAESIEITPPTKTTYNHGESLNLAGGSIKVIYADGSTQNVNINQATITESDGSPLNMSPASYDSTNKVSKTLKIKYTEDEVTEEIDYPIEIINDVKSITMHTNPKTQYNVNEALNLENGEILVTRATGTPEVISLTDSGVEVTGFNSSTENPNLQLTVRFTENGIIQTTNYNVSVTDTVTSIRVTAQPNKTEYNYGESLNLTGARLEVTKGSGTETIDITEGMVSSFNPNSLGRQELTVSYGGQTATEKIVVNVNDYVTGIEVTPPTKLNYEKDEELDLSGGLVTKIMASGEIGETVDLSEEMITTVFNPTQTGPQELTVEYEGFTDTFTVTVADYITGIEIKESPKTEYKYGDEIGTPGGSITVHYGSGATQDIPITPDMITDTDGTPFDTTDVTFEEGQKTATKEQKVTYEGFETTYEITIKDFISKVTITPPSKRDYKYNEDLDLSDSTVTVVMASSPDEPEVIQVTSDMITGYDKTKLGSQTVTISYRDDEGTTHNQEFGVNVTDETQSIELEGTPKTEYIYGENLNLSGLNVVIHKLSGDEKIPVTEEMVSGYNKEQVGEQTITVTYNGQVAGTYKVNVTNPVESLEWITKPKTSYVIGETLDVTGGQFKATKASGEETVVDLTTEMVSGFDTATEGNKTLTVTYEGQKLTYEIIVSDKVNKIEIEDMPKTDYKYGEDLTESGSIKVTNASGQTETVNITPDMITGYNKNQLGQQTVTVSYGGQETTFELTVSDYVTNVVITPPSKVEYEYGEDLDLSDSTVTVTMASTPDEPKVIPVTSDMVTGYDKTEVGSQTVSILYTDDDGTRHTKEFGVRVNDKIKSITLDTTGVKTEYKYGENLDVSNIKLSVTYESGKTEEIPVNTGMISGYNPEQLGSQTITVGYQGLEDTFEVNVTDYVKDISLTPPTKTEYKIGESLSLIGGSITEIMASGAQGNTIPLDQSMVTGFESTTPGTKQVTVTYVKDGETFTKQFEVSVENETSGIEVIPPIKTEYEYGESLDLTGGKVIITKTDNTTEEIKLTQSMISGYNPKQSGQQVVTVTYTDEDGKQFTDSFVVNVGEDYIVSYEFTAPSKKTYEYGEDLDLTGGKITEIMASGETGREIAITRDMVTGFDSEKPGTQTLTVTYNGNKYTYTVTVEDEILGISIKKHPNKLEYKLDEDLDVTGGILNVIKTSGIQEVEITKDMVSGFNPNKSGIQVITVEYEEFTAEYIVYVEKEEVETPPITPDPGDNITNNNTTNNNITNNNTTNNITNNYITNNYNTDNSNNSVTNVTPEKEEKPEEEESNNVNENVPPVIGNIDDNTPPSNNSEDNLNEAFIRGMLAGITALATLAGIILLIALFAKDRKNVKVYIEEGNERVLVGKEKLTNDNRNIDLNKYYDKYKEDEYKVVLSKGISKKLDNKTVNIRVHNKEKDIKVDYQGKEYIAKI